MEVRVDGWSVGARFSGCHFIPHHPKCGRLHGHTYAVSCRFIGEVSPEDDMVMDFIGVKEALRRRCEELDHLVLVPEAHPDVSVAREGDALKLQVAGKRYVLPAEDVKLLPLRSTTAELLSDWFLEGLLSDIELPPNVHAVELGIEEGVGQGAWARRQLR